MATICQKMLTVGQKVSAHNSNSVNKLAKTRSFFSTPETNQFKEELTTLNTKLISVVDQGSNKERLEYEHVGAHA